MAPESADTLIRRNHRLLALAEQARAQSLQARTASFDARIQRCFGINRPAHWADMMWLGSMPDPVSKSCEAVVIGNFSHRPRGPIRQRECPPRKVHPSQPKIPLRAHP